MPSLGYSRHWLQLDPVNGVTPCSLSFSQTNGARVDRQNYSLHTQLIVEAFFNFLESLRGQPSRSIIPIIIFRNDNGARSSWTPCHVQLLCDCPHTRLVTQAISDEDDILEAMRTKRTGNVSKQSTIGRLFKAYSRWVPHMCGRRFDVALWNEWDDRRDECISQFASNCLCSRAEN